MDSLKILLLLAFGLFATDFSETTIVDQLTGIPAKVTSDSALYVTTGGDTSNVKIMDTAQVAMVPFLLKVAAGEVPGWSMDRKFGSIDAIAASTPADVWAYGITPGAETYTWSDTGVNDIDRISSDNSLDTDISILIIGLDAACCEVIQTINLDATDGQTPVALDSSLWRVNRAENANGTALLGNVYIYVNGATSGGVPTDVTKVRAYLPIEDAGTMQIVYTVPVGKTAYFYGLESSLTKSGGATAVGGEFVGKTRAYGKVFRTRDKFQLVSSGTSNRVYNFPIPLVFTEKTDFVGRVDVTANGVGATWSFTILLKDN